MNKIMLAATLTLGVLALSGCAEAVRNVATADAKEWCQRIGLQGAQYSTCVANEYNRRITQHYADADREATLTTLGGAAFINGYNMNRSRTVTCTHIGSITTCN